MTDSTHTLPTAAPPKWMNASMKVFLKTPGLQSVIGQSVALITFTGSKSGTRYTTPVTYYRDGDTVVMLTKRFRRWWRNFETHQEVELRLAGQTVRGRAVPSVDDESTLPLLASFLQHRSRDARYYNVRIQPDGTPNPDDIRALLPQVVLIRVSVK